MPDKINARPAWNAGRVTISFDVRNGSLSVKGSIDQATVDARLTAAAIIAAADNADEKVANLPYTLASDAGHLMAEGAPFAALYFDRPDARVFSLRSTDAGLDVSQIAAQYGGGGHKHAAGFQMPVGWEGE